MMWAVTALSQSRVPPKETSQAFWLSYVGEHAISKRWDLHLEGYGTWLGPISNKDFTFLRPGVRRTFGDDLSTLIAYSYFKHFPAGTGASDSLPEHRISQDIQWSHALPAIGSGTSTLTYRLRHEERFLSTETGQNEVEWVFNQRTRFRATARFPLPQRSRLLPNYVSIYDEVFVNSSVHQTQDRLNQNLTSAGAGWKLRKFLDLELGYLHQYGPSARGSLGAHNQVLTVTLFSNAPWHARRRENEDLLRGIRNSVPGFHRKTSCRGDGLESRSP